MQAKALATGAAAGIGGGLISLGGGTLLIPLLLGWLRLTPWQARGTSIATSLVSAGTGVWVYAQQGMVHWPVILWVGIPAMLITPWAARISEHWPGQRIRRAFGAVVMLGALAVILKDLLPQAPAVATGWETAFLLGVGVIEGLAAGIVGISGGPILAPLFVLGLGMPQHLAQGCSLAARLPPVLAGTLENAREGNILTTLIPGLLAGAFVGAWVGGRLALWLPEHGLRVLFGVFLLGLGLRYMVHGDGSRA